ncbi:hypothetical protein FA13DRAFT_914656 [Coprinellus micaceus]|uniref:Uncharacterized protein n=1 Tax=Coprinellus micaceus TaxID=71717 RepID=A0A4Y7TUC1_COPMI|nr:hypothetical protein FA13DRAFT_914656 [Coprinellus micaceus]
MTGIPWRVCLLLLSFTFSCFWSHSFTKVTQTPTARDMAWTRGLAFITGDARVSWK